MKALTQQLLSLFAAPVLAGLLGAYPTFAQAAPVKEIRIAVPDVSAGQNHSGGGVVDVLYTRQLLEKEFAADGIQVKWTFFKGAGPVINEALANDQVDFAYLGDLAAIIGKSSGLDTRLLAATARGVNHYLGVQPGSGIKSLQDLKGKRVGIFRGTASQLSFDNALAAEGLSEKDLKVISLDFSAALAALAAKQIDATWGLAGLFALRDKGLAEIPLSTRDLGGAGTLQAVLVGNGRFVDAHPELTQRLLKVQLQAVQWASAEGNRDAYIDLVSKQASYPAVIFKSEYQDRGLTEVLSPKLDADFIARLDTSIQAAKTYGLIRRDFKASDWAKPELQEAASKQVAGQPVAALQ